MINRTMCDVLEEMRQCFKTCNFSGLNGLVEEAQSMANRMEAGLGERKDYQGWHNRVKKEKGILKKIIKEKNKHRKGVAKEKMPTYPST